MFSNGTLFTIVLGTVSWCTVAWMMLFQGQGVGLPRVLQNLVDAKRQKEEDAIGKELAKYRQESINEHTSNVVPLKKAA